MIEHGAADRFLLGTVARELCGLRFQEECQWLRRDELLGALGMLRGLLLVACCSGYEAARQGVVAFARAARGEKGAELVGAAQQHENRSQDERENAREDQEQQEP